MSATAAKSVAEECRTPGMAAQAGVGTLGCAEFGTRNRPHVQVEDDEALRLQ
jgi:hypothetical protein